MPIDFRKLLEENRRDRQRQAVCIVGSRDFPHEQLIWDYVDTLPETAIVFSGGARGADSWAEQAAKTFGLQTRVFPAQWTLADGSYNKAAGFQRNEQMIRALCAWPGPKQLVAFWDGRSRGTKHSIDYATEMGLWVLVVLPRF